MKKRMGIVAAVATAMLCSSFAFAAPIKIGLMAPITGAFASEGQDMQKICELMTEELNKAGGINGNKVQLVIEDGGCPRALRRNRRPAGWSPPTCVPPSGRTGLGRDRGLAGHLRRSGDRADRYPAPHPSGSPPRE